MISFLFRYDSLTGVPASQKTVSFEKGSVLFNIGALYTQIGARQDRGTEEGIQTAVENFLRAAGAFRFLRENFSNAPSMDMQLSTLDMLVQLMLVSSPLNRLRTSHFSTCTDRNFFFFFFLQTPALQ